MPSSVYWELRLIRRVSETSSRSENVLLFMINYDYISALSEMPFNFTELLAYKLDMTIIYFWLF